MISVKTNGHLLSEEKIAQLREAGVESVSISLDYLHAPEGEWKDNQSLEAIKRCLKNKFKVMISTCVTHQNIRSATVEDIIRFGHDRNLIVNLSLGAPIGHWSRNTEICITKEDRSYINKLEKKYKNVRTDFDANFITEGCGAVKEKVYVTPYGDVMPCPFLHIKLGNVLNEYLSSIRKRALKNKYWSRYEKICYAAEDLDFINKYLSKTFDSKDLPVNSEIIFDEEE